jgi:hypothetical protein
MLTGLLLINHAQAFCIILKKKAITGLKIDGSKIHGILDTIEPKSLYIITASHAKKGGDHIEC